MHLTHLHKNRLFGIAAISAVSISILLMVFGIGIKAHAATQSNLQPASGAAEFRAEDGTTQVAAANDAHNEDGSHDSGDDAGIIGMFGINWKLFAAQLINFGIVLFVLWKFVWKPVTSGLSERTDKIEQSLADAQKITEDRLTFDSWKQAEMVQVRKEAAAILTEAKQLAESVKSDTIKATTEEQSRIIEQAQKRLDQEKTTMLDSAKAELADIVVRATETILQQKINPATDKKLIDEALKKAHRS